MQLTRDLQQSLDTEDQLNDTQGHYEGLVRSAVQDPTFSPSSLTSGFDRLQTPHLSLDTPEGPVHFAPIIEVGGSSRAQHRDTVWGMQIPIILDWKEGDPMTGDMTAAWHFAVLEGNERVSSTAHQHAMDQIKNTDPVTADLPEPA